MSRTTGSLHSCFYSNIITQETILLQNSKKKQQLMKYKQINYNDQDNTVICGSSVLLSDLYEYLVKKERYLIGLPEIDKITVGGAISVGAHGGGLNYSTLSDQIKSMVILNPSGEEITITNDELKICSCSVGMTGIIVRLEFKTVHKNQFRI